MNLSYWATCREGPAGLECCLWASYDGGCLSSHSENRNHLYEQSFLSRHPQQDIPSPPSFTDLKTGLGLRPAGCKGSTHTGNSSESSRTLHTTSMYLGKLHISLLLIMATLCRDFTERKNLCLLGCRTAFCESLVSCATRPQLLSMWKSVS